MPSRLIIQVLLARKDVRPHSSGIEGLCLLEVVQIDAIFLPSSHVSHLEVVPLKMSLSVRVDPHEAIILELSNPKSRVEVSRLEQRIKPQRICFCLRMHAGEYSIREYYSLLAEMMIRKGDIEYFPGRIGAGEACAEVAKLMLAGIGQGELYGLLEEGILEDEPDRFRKMHLGRPSC